MKLKHLPIFMASGLVSILLLSIVYFQRQTMCSLSVAAVPPYLAPSFAALFSAVLWKTPLTKNGSWRRWRRRCWGACWLSGMLSGVASASWTGMALGVASGLTYASYTVFAHYGLAHYESYTMISLDLRVRGAGVDILRGHSGACCRCCGSRRACGRCVLAVIVVPRRMPYYFYTKGSGGRGERKSSPLSPTLNR